MIGFLPEVKKTKPVSPVFSSNTIVNCIAIGAEKNPHFFFC